MNKNNEAQVSQKSSRNQVPSDHYQATPSNDVKRIQAPHPNDVLCGRGGGVNSHNKNFRTWVRERKDVYILATSKLDKAGVAREIVQIVQNQSPPGRFLIREATEDIPPSTYWIEIDEDKAIRKCCQALREGAPAIRSKAKSMSNHNMKDEEGKHEHEEIQNNRKHKTKRMRLMPTNNLLKDDHEAISKLRSATDAVPQNEERATKEEKRSSPEDTIKLLERIISLNN